MTAKHRAWRFGRFAETLCVVWLRLRAYRILARRYRTPVGEIDIVARRGKILAFIEVKARGTIDDAAESIRPRQRDRIVRAAEWYCQHHPHVAACQVRFDAMLTMRGRIPKHICDAWRP